jgi:hypothetical protein
VTCDVEKEVAAPGLLTLAASLINQEPEFGAARGIRTPDPIITNDVLYQLSYCGPFE